MSDADPVCVVRLPEGFTQLLSLTQLYLNDAFLEFLPASFGRSVCCPIWIRMKFFLTWEKEKQTNVNTNGTFGLLTVMLSASVFGL